MNALNDRVVVVTGASSGIGAATVRLLHEAGAKPATKCAVNRLSEVARMDLADDNIQVTLLLPSITATEFGDGIFQDGRSRPRGLIPHSPEYVAKYIRRALRTGEERIDIPHGPEQPVE